MKKVGSDFYRLVKGKVLFLLLPYFSLAQQFTPKEIARYKSEAQHVTIIRDNWGVPHIYGKSDADAVFGLLYAECEENFRQVERNYLEFMGRLSEVDGKSKLYQDLEMRLIYDSSAAKSDYRKCPSWFRKLLDAFADGVNYYLATHPNVKPAVLKKFEPWFPFMYTDGSISATQTGGLTIKDLTGMYPINDSTSSSFNQLNYYCESELSGSNGFAIGPSRTSSKKALLYINPHVTFYFRDEVQIVSEEGLNTYGAVTWGQFFVYQGFNEHCGWMHTSSVADVADLFIEKITKRNDSLYYLYDGKLLPVKTKNIRINFSSGNGSYKEEFLTYATGHGPVVGLRNNEWLSLKERNRSLEALMQSWLRTKAKGFEDFRKVMEMRSNNSNNTVFADDKGNIAYWHGNFMPIRDPKYDWTLPVDGSTSATEWKGLYKLEEIVHVYNPSSGWIQNCNSTPFTCCGSGSPTKENYPAYMAPDGQNGRALNAMKLLPDQKNLTIEHLISDIGYSHYLIAFETLLPPLFKAYEALDTSDTLHKPLAEAIGLLKSWSKISSDTSVATSLAIEWGFKLAQKATPTVTPEQSSNGLEQWRSMLSNSSAKEKLDFLVATLNELKTRFGKWNVAWGEVNRFQRLSNNQFDDNKSSLAVGLAPGTWGCIPSFVGRRFPGKNKRYGVSGNSFIAAVEFGQKVKAKSVITGGESFDPTSKHFSDQDEMFIQGKFKDVLFYKEDVLKHLERKYHPGE